jgi:hypothetical protein
MNTQIFSLHWENIDPRIPHYQKKVMDKHKLPIQQHCISGFDHGEWMEWVMRRSEGIDIVLFMDVDCIILDRDKAMTRIQKAHDGTLVGNEQATNHLGEFVASRVFVAPSFMAVHRHAWKALGEPSFKATPLADVGQNLTDVWQQRNVPVDFLRVSGCDIAKWDLPNKPQHYGIGTTFADTTYHLFESRDPANADRFVKKCEEVLK